MTDTNVDAVDVSCIDRDKSHLIRADYDGVRIANAVRRSPHFTAAYANPGDYDIVFSTPDTGDGRAWRLVLEDPAPSDDDDMLGEPVLHEALAAAILNHPDFVAATPDYPSDGDITIHTRDGRRYLAVLGIATDEDTALLKQPAPVAPPGDARTDVVHIAAALRSSPHIRSVAPVGPGDEAVWFKDADGHEYELALVSSEPIPDAPSAAYAWDAVAAAVGSHPHFIRSVLEQRSFGPLNLDTVTADTRTGTEYTRKLTLKLPGDLRPEHDSRPASPTADLTAAADQLLHPGATDADRAMAGLLNHVAATWDNLDAPLREHAHAVARTLTR